MPDRKLEMLSVVWGVGGLLLALTILFANANLVVIVMLSIALLGGTMGIVDSTKNTTQKDDEDENENESRREKAKRGEGAAATSSHDALLRLLSEEDCEELRHRVKQRLLDTIEQGSDGELSSLDALLAEQQTRAKR